MKYLKTLDKRFYIYIYGLSFLMTILFCLHHRLTKIITSLNVTFEALYDKIGIKAIILKSGARNKTP